MKRRSIHYHSLVLTITLILSFLTVLGCNKQQDTDLPNSKSASHNGDEIESQVKRIVSELLNIDAKILKLSDRFVADLGADDLDAVELIMEFEDTFGLSISDEAAEKMVRIKDAIDYIRKHQTKK